MMSTDSVNDLNSASGGGLLSERKPGRPRKTPIQSPDAPAAPGSSEPEDILPAPRVIDPEAHSCKGIVVTVDMGNSTTSLFRSVIREDKGCIPGVPEWACRLLERMCAQNHAGTFQGEDPKRSQNDKENQ
jgi:hypothetical protein